MQDIYTYKDNINSQCPVLPRSLFKVLGSIIGCITLFCLLFNANAFAQLAPTTEAENYVTIDSSTHQLSLNTSFSWLEDSSHSLDINKVSQPKMLQQFRRNDKPLFNLGYTMAPVWFHIPIKYADTDISNTDNKPGPPWLLEIAYPMLDLIDIYVLRSNGAFNHLQLGDSLAFERRPVKAQTFMAPIALAAGEKVDIFIRVRTSSSLQMPISIGTQQAKLEQQVQENSLYGIYFGIMAVMVIYNLIIYLSFRDSSYLYYVFFVASFGLLQAVISGHAFQYLWPHSTLWVNIACPVLVALAAFFGLQFSSRFLSLNEHLPRLDRALTIVSGFALIIAFGSLVLHPAISIKICLLLALVTSISLIAAGLTCLKRNDSVAKLFVLAWFCLLPGISLYCLALIDVLPMSGLIGNVGLYGSLVEVIILSLALSSRINVLRQQGKAIRKRAQHQLQNANAQLNKTLLKLEQNNKLKDQFLATISHELRTPMNGVEGSLNLIKTSRLSKTQLGYLETAKLSAKAMTALVDSILSFSEMQSGDLQIKQQPFELRKMLNPESVDFLQRCRQKGLNFNWHIDKNIPMIINSDCDQILLVLKQLMDNAIKFTQHGHISVNIYNHRDQKTLQDMLSISVVDTGDGIPTEQMKNIYDPFHQLDGNYNRRHNGLGIGLTICHQLASMMGGKLEVESELGQGTEVIFTLPLNSDNIEQLSCTEEEQKNQDHQKKTILIAEDNPVNQMVLKGILEQMGCITLIANNGEEVSELLASQPVDLIMMDCQMPLIDGFEATRRIRRSQQAYSNIPIIAVTANAMTGDSVRCLDAGMNDYIKKPIDRNIVEGKVKRWLQNGKLAA